MLIDFTIKNYRSIKDPATLSLLATNIKDHPENGFESPREPDIGLLKAVVIYGANASGKSNVIKAFDTVRSLVVESANYQPGQIIRQHDPYRLEKGWIDRPTEFEMEFIAEDSIRYRYKVSFDQEEILEESLVFFPKGHEANLFHREQGQSIKFGDYFSSPAKTVEKQLLENQLFLSKAANSNNKILKKIYLYFGNSLRLSYPSTAIPLTSFTTTECLKDRSCVDKSVFGEFLRAADTGIERMEILREVVPEDDKNTISLLPEELKNRLLEDMAYRPRMHHKLYEDEHECGTVAFDLAEESKGTINLYDIAGKILHVLGKGLVLIADELNSSLHPQLTRMLVELFHDPETNPNNAQLVFATHDTALLSPELFRRDQIWLTEKDRFGATSLFSISEFDYRKVRSNVPFDRWYLSGRFGALPVLAKFKHTMKNAEKTECE